MSAWDTHEDRLELVQYKDRMATFEALRLPLMQGEPTWITLHLRYEDWQEMGKPTELLVSYTVAAS